MQRLVTLIILLALSLAFLIGLSHCFSGKDSPRVLLFTKSEFYIHDSTPEAVKALQKVCKDWDILLDVEDDPYEVFTEKNLSRYAAVIFLNTAGDVLNFEEEALFERYIQAGGGFVGVHTAVDTEHNWKWYRKLIGASFDSQSKVQEATLQVQDHYEFPTRHLDSSFQWTDEWFNLNNFDYNVQVLLTVDEATYQGGNMGAHHPVSWCHEYDGGRSFVTTLGHTPEVYQRPELVQHLYGAIIYAIGKNKPIKFKERKAYDTPQTTGFVKTELLCDLYEPMEFDMLPDGKILFIERRGAIKLFDPNSGHVGVLHEMAVFLDNEEGLTGMALDPNWEKNHWIYFYYSPEGDEPVSYLSRFVFDGKALDLGSEKILLQVQTEREQLCHHGGGSIEFDGNGYLYLSTGDNTSPYDVDGYTPIDERPGRSAWDAQKSASNTRDLRGKILRIKPLADGSYICPAGNLFVQKDVTVSAEYRVLLEDPLLRDLINPAKTRQNRGRIGLTPLSKLQNTVATTTSGGAPEIFVMGCRNPFRFSVDSRRNLLAWGDIGCDAGLPDSTRGPEGYDEINWTRDAGFFGWPYFIGDNEAYRDYDFETQVSRAAFDPKHPINDSPNNTGAQKLPPAQPAGIWYPFRTSAKFPLVANGTRCSMAGPVYYCDEYPAETRFPDRFDGTLIIYEWMRNWIMAVTLDSLDQYVKMEPLADGVRVARPIDMMIDKNGSLWLLEYGTEWYSSNPDACLSRIDYVRTAPGSTIAANNGNNTSDMQQVHWDFSGKNRSFYQPGDILNYQVLIGSHSNAKAPEKTQSAGLDVTVDYVEAGLNPFASDAKPGRPLALGQKLIEGSDCTSCHAVNRQINGPSYAAIAKRYEQDKSAKQVLVQKILKGGTGNWGNQMMSAHPQIKESDVQEMVVWILEQGKPKKTLPLSGQYSLSVPEKRADGTFIFTAKSNNEKQTELIGATAVLRPTLQQAELADSISNGVRQFKPSRYKTTVLNELRDQSFFAYRSIDLYGIESVRICLGTGFAKHQPKSGKLELRLNGPNGELVGSIDIPVGNKRVYHEVEIPISTAKLQEKAIFHDLYFVARSADNSSGLVAAVDWVQFNL